uniref:Uncharacterized protein n=1 Tax=Anguilla anguilla TaxID=7936 RepID=A0A0E9RYR8_ANGAN
MFFPLLYLYPPPPPLQRTSLSRPSKNPLHFLS